MVSTVAYGVLGTALALGFVFGVLLGGVLGLSKSRRISIPLAVASFAVLLLWFILPLPADAGVFTFVALIGASVGLIIGGIAKEVATTQTLVKQLLKRLEEEKK